MRTFEVTDFEFTRRYDRYTPYQPWREIYEIPLAAVAVVAGVGANIVNVFALGRLPDSVTKEWIDCGVAGLNPFMNIQSNGRAEQIRASVDEVRNDQRQEISSQPWGNKPVKIQSGRQSLEIRTARDGSLNPNLLDDPFGGP